MKRGEIVVCYHGVGKTTLAMSAKGVAELTANLFSDGDGWYKTMARVAVSLSRQGITVLLPYSEPLMDWLDENGTAYSAVFPSMEMKDAWRGALKKRYDETRDKKRLDSYNATRSYESDIARMMRSPSCKVIKDMDYKLLDLVVYGVGNIRKDVFGMFGNMIFSSGGEVM